MRAGVALLLLADGRTPAGAYAHSFGLESAVTAGDVVDLSTLSNFVEATLRTAATVDAGFAAAVCERTRAAAPAAVFPQDADDEYDARVTAPALASRSRELGRYLLRLGLAAWPDPVLEAAQHSRPRGWHHPVALGLVAASAGLDARDAATCAVYGLVAGIASAGVRLLGLDPVAVHAAQARLAGACDDVAAAAAGSSAAPFASLPSRSAPLFDVRAERHAAPDTPRLFAS